MIVDWVRQQWHASREMRRYHKLPGHLRAITFYAEDASAMKHFQPIITALTGPMDRTVCYLTSSPDDPVLDTDNRNIRSFFIGDGPIRTAGFMSLRTRVCVMTMPDLHTMHIKRSMVAPVHYVYVFHSMVSTHMIYRPDAFDHYDSILCCGPHHIREIRARERQYGLPTKQLIENGYSHLDTMMQGILGRTMMARERPRVLVAPSWGPDALLETCGAALCERLLETDCEVVLRPHPRTVSRNGALVAQLYQQFSDSPRFTLDDSVSSDSFADADLMVSDYSGAALEYAFAFERPVLFVDVPRKVRNPAYADIPHVPIEVSIRERIGRIVSPENLSEVPAAVEELTSNADSMRNRIRNIRDDTIYNPARSGHVAAEHIANVAAEVQPARNHNHGREHISIPNLAR